MSDNNDDNICNEKKINLEQNDKNKKLFMDAVTLSLYSKTIGQNNTRPSNIRKYSDCINWKDVNHPPTCQDYAMFVKDNENISLNVL